MKVTPRRLIRHFYQFMIFLVSIPGLAHSKTIFIWDQEPYLQSQEVLALQCAILSLDTCKTKPEYRVIDVVKLKDSYYVLPNGLNDIYLWSGHQLTPVFESPFQGQNFGSKKYVYHNEIYSYGGYGYWNFYADITRFDQITKEWVLVPGFGEKPFVESTNFRYCFIRDSILYAYFQWSWPYRTTRHNPISDDRLYTYNLNSYTWKFEGDVPRNFPRQPGFVHYESRNYTLEINKEGVGVLLNNNSLEFKSNLALYRNASLYPDLVDGSTLSCRQVRNDSIFLYDSSHLQFVIDLASIDQMSGGIYEPFVKAEPWNRYQIGIGGLCLIILGGVLFYVRKRKSPGVTQPIFSAGQEPPSFPKLKNYLNQTIVQSVLDDCLQISQVASVDILRNKRSSFIKQINEDPANPYHIQRVRNEEDSRIYDYHIRYKANI